MPSKSLNFLAGGSNALRPEHLRLGSELARWYHIRSTTLSFRGPASGRPMWRGHPGSVDSGQLPAMAQLTFTQALRNAIEAEYAASRFYRLLAESTRDHEARAFLDGMAAVEVEHAHAIEVQAMSLVEGRLPNHADSIIDVIETVPTWKFVDDISFDAALEIARAAELQAELYYDAMADSLTGTARAFFRDLARLEAQHAKVIEQRRPPRL